MASFYRASVQEFLLQDEEQILARLSLAYANRGYTSQHSDQTLTWSRDLASLRQCLQQCVLRSDFAKHWGLLLEFSIPRKESRIDIVVLIRDVVVILEAKSGSLGDRAKRQVEEYALLLHYFHKPSSEHKILPVLVSAIPFAESHLARPRQLTRSPQLPTSWIAQVVSSSWQDLSQTLLSMEDDSKSQLCAPSWDEGVYFPVPSISRQQLH